jgi:hypothetical protein
MNKIDFAGVREELCFHWREGRKPAPIAAESRIAVLRALYTARKGVGSGKCVICHAVL